jgi:hypothetical protein
MDFKQALLIVIAMYGGMPFTIEAIASTQRLLAAEPFEVTERQHWQDEQEEKTVIQEPSLLVGVPQEYTRRVRKRKKHGYVGQAIGEFITTLGRDALVLNKNLFTWNTFKVISGIFPVFVGARMIDEKLQRCFYNRELHKNVNQMPLWCHEVAKASIGLPIVMLGVDAFFNRNDDRRWTGQILLIGMPFVIWTKTLIKKIKFEACLRPWNEQFSCEQRAFGVSRQGTWRKHFI